MAATNSKRPNGRQVRRNELVISAVLQTGVIASAVLLIVGLGRVFVRHGETVHHLTSYHQLTTTSYAFPHTFSSVHAALLAGDSQGYIMLGLLLLILTPIIRVVVSVVLFAYERDKPMVLITLFVLVVLISSYFIGITT